MSLETAQKFKKIFVFIVLGVLAITFIHTLSSALFFPQREKHIGLEYTTNTGSDTFVGKTLSRDSFNGYISEQSAPSSPSEIASVPAMAESQPSTTENVIVERKLMQDGSLALSVRQVENGVKALEDVAKSFGGFTDSVNYQNTEGAKKKTAIVVFRVPAVHFEKAMTQSKAIAISVTSENIARRDVTEQFVDMQARLKTLKSTEEQYLEIMKKAVKIEDVLNVSRYLSDVRVQIEQLQGQMNYLSRQVDMSIITVYLSSEPEINPGNVVWNPGTVAKDSMRSFVTAFYSFIDSIIRLVLFYLPIIVLLGGLLFLIFLFFMKVIRPWYEASKDILHF